ncbi:MAG: hypothetical protein JXR67_04995 [Bacteroidales bacterium]|nr:hypothetical protein [Bacteroidales bacterium]
MKTDNYIFKHSKWLVICSVLLFILLTPSSGQNIPEKGIKKPAETQWWYPVIKDMGMDAGECMTSDNLCIAGGTITKTNDRIIAEDALILIRKGESEYQVLKSAHVSVDTAEDILQCGKGTLKTYLLASPGKDPVGEASFANLIVQLTGDTR